LNKNQGGDLANYDLSASAPYAARRNNAAVVIGFNNMGFRLGYDEQSSTSNQVSDSFWQELQYAAESGDTEVPLPTAVLNAAEIARVPSLEWGIRWFFPSTILKVSLRAALDIHESRGTFIDNSSLNTFAMRGDYLMPDFSAAVGLEVDQTQNLHWGIAAGYGFKIWLYQNTSPLGPVSGIVKTDLTGFSNTFYTGYDIEHAGSIACWWDRSFNKRFSIRTDAAVDVGFAMSNIQETLDGVFVAQGIENIISITPKAAVMMNMTLPRDMVVIHAGLRVQPWRMVYNDIAQVSMYMLPNPSIPYAAKEVEQTFRPDVDILLGSTVRVSRTFSANILLTANPDKANPLEIILAATVHR
jgi:hypothetical protein